MTMLNWTKTWMALQLELATEAPLPLTNCTNVSRLQNNRGRWRSTRDRKIYSLTHGNVQDNPL